MRSWSKSVLSLACALLLCVLPLFSAAADTSWAVVHGTASLNVRATPSTSGVWRGAAKRGDWVQIIYPSENNWYYCRVVSSNVTGYMSGNYLQMPSSSGTPSANKGIIYNPSASGYVNLRSLPSYAGSVIGIMHNHDEVTLLGLMDGWYSVIWNGIPGFVVSQFVSTSSAPSAPKTAVVSTGNAGKLNMRTAPTSSGAIKTSYANGTKVTVLLEGNEFAMVSVGTVTGFMASKYLKMDGSSGGGGGVIPPVTTGYCIVKNDNPQSTLNLRQTASQNGRVLAKLHNGEHLDVLEQGETWCKVYYGAGGLTGYVMTKYVHLHNLPASPDKTISNGGSYVNLRSKGNYSASVILRVYSGSKVTVLIPGDVWTRVRYQTHEGYVLTHFLK